MSRLVVLAFLLCPALALANGRPAQTKSVAFQPGDSQRILLGVTFGLLLSDDDGQTFRWTCEKNIGYGGEFDPVYAATPAGTLLAGTFDGLSISRDSGCNWSKVATGEIDKQWIADIQIAPSGAIWTVTSSGAYPNDVFVSKDDGATFQPGGLVTDRAWWKSVRLAPDREQRVYVSGYYLVDEDIDAGGSGAGSLPLMRVSDDGGQTWTELPFSFEDENEVYFVGVLPGTQGDVVFARVNGRTKDTLLRSDDGALSWEPVLTLEGEESEMTFAVLDGGTRLIAGSSITNGWARVSDDGGLTWTTPAKQPEMACVGQRVEGGDAFSCGNNWNPDRFALGRSSDGGQSWNKVVRFVELDGELECPDESIHHMRCSAEWKMWEGMFGIGVADAGVPEPVDASVTPPAPPRKPDCGGCGIALGVLFFVSPWTRRRQSLRIRERFRQR